MFILVELFRFVGEQIGFEVLVLVPGTPWFNSSVALVQSQQVCLLPVGILNLLSLFQLFVSLALKSPSGQLKYSCGSTRPFSHGKVRLYPWEVCVLCVTSIPTVKLPMGNHYGYIKKNKRITHDVSQSKS